MPGNTASAFATRVGLVFAAAFGLLSAASQQARAETCSQAKIDELLEPAAPGNREVQINCTLALGAPRTITKRIEISGSRASNIVVDLGGSRVSPASGPPLTIQS